MTGTSGRARALSPTPHPVGLEVHGEGGECAGVARAPADQGDLLVPASFAEPEPRVHGETLKALLCPARPLDGQGVHPLRSAEAKVELQGYLALKARVDLHEVALHDAAGLYDDLGAERVVLGTRCLELEAQEVAPLVRRLVLQEPDALQARDRQVKVTVSIEVDRDHGAPVVGKVDPIAVGRLEEARVVCV